MKRGIRESVAVSAALLAVLLIFLNVEKDIGKKQAEIKARREERA